MFQNILMNSQIHNLKIITLNNKINEITPRRNYENVMDLFSNSKTVSA